MLIIEAAEKNVISIKKTLFVASALVDYFGMFKKGSFLCCNLFN